MHQEQSDAFEWYIYENLRSPPSPVGRALRLGPFATEQECCELLTSIREIPRFNHDCLEVRKKRNRREKRVSMELPAELRRYGIVPNPQLVRTVDISYSGARLTGLDQPLKFDEVLEISSGRRQAAFRVVWIGSPGTPTGGQAGVECLTPEVNLWELDLSQFQDKDEDPLLREMAAARTVQSKLLPEERPPLSTLDYEGDCIQARAVGGDYYDFLDMGQGEVGFVLADVAGKGMAAALLMANLQGALRSQYRVAQRDLPRLLAAVNRNLYRHTERFRYATVFFGCYSDATRTLHYVNCGHNPPLLLRRGGTVEQLEATATVLGLFLDWECSVAQVRLAAGDVLSLYSDGITEATAENGEEFGEARLLETLRANRHLGAAAMLHQVEHAVEQFRSGEPTDDVTMVVACSR
ncbi:MAG: PP2C family protein-serine/threonine phosphatase [Terriglobales bacterium]